MSSGLDLVPHAVALVAADGTVEQVNARWRDRIDGADHLGRALPGARLRDHLYAAPRAQEQLDSYLWQGIERVLSGRSAGFELNYEVPGDPPCWSLLCVTARAGGAVLSLTDTTVHLGVQSAFADLAFHDRLTGLPDRYLVVERLRHVLRQRRCTDAVGAVVFIDLDRFKQVNDRHGHHIGDAVLVEAARRLKRCIRESETCGRWGGDEFVLLVEVPDVEGLGEVLLELDRAFLAPFDLRGLRLDVRLSIGAVTVGEADSAEELVRRADFAMYRSKRSRSGAEATSAPRVEVAR